MARQPVAIELSDNTLNCRGDWTVQGIEDVGNRFFAPIQSIKNEITISGSDIEHMDTAGAWILHRILTMLKKQNVSYELSDFNKEQKRLLELIDKRSQAIKELPKLPKLNPIAMVGKNSITSLHQMSYLLEFIGELFLYFVSLLAHPRRIRWKYFFNIIEVNGFRALPLIGFLSFLIGVVLTYQTGLELQTYGANIFIINLLGLAIFREFGSLITAIIVAGRTGAAFTAQLGIMKVNEEVDALRTMGHSPIEMLVLPRIFGLIIVMPLLVVWADAFGILGGMVMSKNLLSINYITFLNRFPESVTLTSFLIGIGKAPVFAAIIASVGCYYGFRVSGSAESVGWQTTKSVVTSIFLVIIADAAFSILFSWLGI